MKPVALITGAGSGIGLAISHYMAEQGYHVMVTDMNESAIDSAVAAITNVGGSASGHILNVASQGDIEAIVDAADRVDVLINNAGIQHVAKLEEFPADRWRLLIDVLLSGPAMLCRQLMPKMKAQNYGRIINVGSIHALVASPYKSAYVAAKHGLLGFSKTLALETSAFDITINTLCPSYVKTPLVEKQIADQAKQHGISEEEVVNSIMLEPMPKKEFISMDELCDSIGFLISPAAKNMTGQTLVLDGGWTAK